MGRDGLMSTKQLNKNKNGTESAGKKNKSGKKNTNYVGIICGTALGVIVLSGGLVYFGGKSYYNSRFLANTTVNGVDVSSMNYDKACREIESKEVPKELTVSTIDGKKVKIDTSEFDYKSNVKDEVKKLIENVNPNTWFSGFAGDTDYEFKEKVSYDSDKLKEALKNAGWGDTETKNAEIENGKDGYTVSKEVQGNKVTNMDKLCSYVDGQVKSGNFNVELNADTGCYTLPEVTADELAEKCENLNKIADLSITYDFDYTTETLKGEKLRSLLDIDSDGTYTANWDKCMKYVESLAKKYDTYNKKRKFHATLQGDIIVPPSSDAKYGWWIDQNKTCEALVNMLNEGKTVKKVDPIYYDNGGGYVFTGVESARSKDDDIGKTYVEIDLTAQHLWVYKKGKKVYECDIVSGQTTSMARTTLPGVYKVWSKATNYRMKDTNADGESWDTTCNYWNRVAIVGIGLHDTVTRSAFGGTIYQYLGSHGCINMPLEGAKYIYDKVAMGTPVVMYYSKEMNKQFGFTK